MSAVSREYALELTRGLKPLVSTLCGSSQLASLEQIESHLNEPSAFMTTDGHAVVPMLNYLQARATADLALEALVRITELLDDDCDASGTALYNPRATLTEIRKVLASTDAALTEVRA